MAGGGDIPVDHRAFDLGRHVTAGVLQHRGKIISRVTRHCVLKIKQSEMSDALALADQHDVLGMIIAQHSHRSEPVARDRGEDFAPRRPIRVRVHIGADRRAIPFDEQPELVEPLVEPVRPEARHRRVLVKMDQHVRRQLVQFALARRILVEELAQPPVAEITEQEQALVKIASKDLRRAQTDRREPFGNGDERPRILVRRRRVHQHGGAIPLDHAEIAAEGRVARKRQDLRAVGAALGISEDAAQKRVNRALEKLRTFLSRRDVTLTATTLATTLATESVVAAPAGLAVSVTAASLAGAAAAGTGISATLMKLMATTELKTCVISAIVIASVVTPLMVQQQAQVRLRNQDGALRQQMDQLANLQEQNERLSNLLAKANGFRSPSNDQLSELMRLRGEMGRLQTAVQELTGPKTNEPLSREEVLASMRQMYLGRVDRLKQLFTTNPAEAVPELQFVTDDQWLRLVEYDHHRIDPDIRRVMSLARSGAQIRFAHTVLDHALQEYGKNNGGQFPTDLSLLAPYFKSPVDDSILRNWTILPTSSLPSGMRVDEDWVITQKASVNAELDQRVVIGMKSSRLGSGGTNDWAVSLNPP